MKQGGIMNRGSDIFWFYKEYYFRVYYMYPPFFPLSFKMEKEKNLILFH
jgi:hypothetical protein